MPYRDELEALKERHALLERNLEEILTASKTLEATRAQEVEVRAQIAMSAARLETMAGTLRRPLPMLDNIHVASPCPADWDKMKGDDRVRHCGECKKNVYDLSELTREAAQTLISENEGQLCATFFRRADGTIVTADCDMGATRDQRNRRFLNVAVVAIGTALLASMALHALGKPVACQRTTGAVSHL